MRHKLIYLLVSLGAVGALGLWLSPADESGPTLHPEAASEQHSVPSMDALGPGSQAFAGEAGASAAGIGVGVASIAASTASTPQIERGVKYLPLDQQQLPHEWKQHLREQLRNLRETGSLSGGKVTHEFSLLGPMADNLRNKGIDQLRSQLAIQPSDLGQVLSSAFHLVGADIQGKQVEGLGAAGFFQILRNPGTGQLVELSENQLDVLGGDGTVIAPEFQNDRVDQFPATLERVVDRDGATLHNLQWVAKDRTFHLSTRNLSADETRQVALGISQRFLAMSNDGWRRRYDYDPENPMHRLARPQNAQRGRW